jgi:hypothetical protein
MIPGNWGKVEPGWLARPLLNRTAPQYSHQVGASTPVYKEPPEHQQAPSVAYHFHYHFPPQLLHPYYFDMAPRKAVHWEDEIPRTPSPAMSASSLTSSSGPVTPENYMQPLPPVQVYQQYQYGTYLAVPEQYSKHHRSQPSAVSPMAGATSVHQLLSAPLFAHSNTQPFIWALYEHPNSMTSLSSPSMTPGYPIPTTTLSLPATQPPMSKLAVTCALLPFTLHIEASRAFGQSYVTIGDLLCGIYSQLRTQLSSADYRQLCRTPDVQQSVSEAFYSRCSVLREGRRDEEQRGLRRSDLLMASQMFAGLEMRGDTALMHVRPLPRH